MHIVITDASNGFIITSRLDSGPDIEKVQIAHNWDGVMEIVQDLDPDCGKINTFPLPTPDKGSPDKDED